MNHEWQNCEHGGNVGFEKYNNSTSTLTYASESWAWNESQRSRVQAVKMSYLRNACGVIRMDGTSNENVYERFEMCHRGEGKKCGVVEEVK